MINGGKDKVKWKKMGRKVMKERVKGTQRTGKGC